MIVFSVILFAASAVFAVLGTLIFRGRTDLIHDYHQENVKEKEKRLYGRKFAKAMFCFAVTFASGGIITLFGNTKPILLASVTVLAVGLAVSVTAVCLVQKKYNG